MVKKTLILLFMLIPTTNLWAAQDVGMIIMSKGDVRAEDNHQSRPLKRKSKVFLNDIIVTNENGYAQLRINDGTIISINSNTKYSVEEFNLDKKNPENNKYVGKIIEGSLISLSSRGDDSTHKNHMVKTPVVSIAIRGTLFELTSQTTKATETQLKDLKNSKKNNQALLACKEVFTSRGSTKVVDGALEVKNNSDGRVICDLSANNTNNNCSWASLGCFSNNIFTPINMPLDNQPMEQLKRVPISPGLEKTIRGHKKRPLKPPKPGSP